MRSRPPQLGQKSKPAPVGGLNALDAIAQMPPMDALIMDNAFPSPTDVSTRKGYKNWVTGLPGWVETLMKYNSTTANKLFAASVTGFYDVTSTGAVSSAVVTGLTNARWQHLNFEITSGSYLYAVNGVDKPRLYDGTNWVVIDGSSTPAITGVTTTLLIDVHLHKNRVWFIEKNSMRVWYLPIQAIGGAAQSIDFGSLFQFGGYLMTMASWSVSDAGGVNDYAAFISSEGEVALYQGTDPASASTWALTGLFRIGRPTGRRCVTRLGSDIAIICADGLFPLSKALLTDRNQLNLAISNKIVNLINTDVQLYAGNFGWQPIVYPTGNKLIINVPQTENSVQYQYVMNTITGAWCTFGKYSSPWNAACFEVLTDKLYFGGNTIVALADHGFNDNGATIFADIKPAFDYFDSPGQNKRFNQVRLILLADGGVNASLALNVDFGDVFPTATPNFNGSGGAVWDATAWNTTPWGGASVISKNWQTVVGIGFSATLRVRLASSTYATSWQSTDFIYEYGGSL